MSKGRTITGQWVSGHKKIECNLPLIIFQDDNNYITYCPALDLSGYGASEEDANHSFEQTLTEYFRYTINKNTLAEDLRKLGWTIRKGLIKPFTPPTMANLLDNNEDFNRIFNRFDFRKRSTTINMPSFV